MAEDVTTLTIKVSADGVEKSQKQIDGLSRSAKQAEGATSGLTRHVKMLASAFAAYGGITAAKEILQTADAFAQMTARLALATGSTENATRAYNDLLNLVRASHSDIQSTTDLYTKMAISTKEMGLSHEGLLTVTDSVAKAMRLSGAGAAESATAIRQLGQAMASGVLRGDEFNSVMENAPRVAKALADGMGVEVGALRDMAAEGRLTASELTKALMTQNEVLTKEVGTFGNTISTSMQDIKNEIFDTFGQTATGPLVDSMQEFVSLLKDPETKEGLRNFASLVVDITGALVKSASAVGNAYNEFSKYFDLMNENDGLKKTNMEIETLDANIAELEKRKGQGGVWGLFAGGETGIGIDFHLTEEEINTQIEKMKEWKKELEAVKTHGGAIVEPPKAEAATFDMQAELDKVEVYQQQKQAKLDLAEAEKKSNKDSAREAKQAADEEKRRLEQIKDYIMDMQTEVTQLGMTEAQIVEDRLKSMGATADQIKEAVKLTGQKEIYELEQDLMTQEELIRQSYERRREIILANTVAGSDKQNNLLGQNEQNFNSEITTGGGWDAPASFEDEMAILNDQYEQKRIAAEGHQETLFELERLYSMKKLDLQTKYVNGYLATGQQLADGVAGVMAGVYGEQSKQARAAFAVSKAFQIAQAMMSAYDMANKAAQSQMGIPYVGPALGAAAAAGALAMGLANVASIRSQNFSGAHDAGGTIGSNQVGIVGEHGMELISGSANVLGRKETANLLENATGENTGGGGKSEVKVLVVNMLDNAALLEQFRNSDEFDEVILNSLGRNKSAAREATS